MRTTHGIAVAFVVVVSGCHAWGAPKQTSSRVVGVSMGPVSVRAQTYRVEGGVIAGDVVMRIQPRSICERTETRSLQITYRQRRDLNRAGMVVFRTGNIAALAGLALLLLAVPVDGDAEKTSSFESISLGLTGAGVGVTFGIFTSFLFARNVRTHHVDKSEKRWLNHVCPTTLIRLPADARLIAPWGDTYRARIEGGTARFVGVDWKRAATSVGQPWSVLIDGVAVRWAPTRAEIKRSAEQPPADTTPPSPASPRRPDGSVRSPGSS